MRQEIWGNLRKSFFRQIGVEGFNISGSNQGSLMSPVNSASFSMNASWPANVSLPLIYSTLRNSSNFNINIFNIYNLAHCLFFVVESGIFWTSSEEMFSNCYPELLKAGSLVLDSHSNRNIYPLKFLQF